jgi:hypothetical protein
MAAARLHAVMECDCAVAREEIRPGVAFGGVTCSVMKHLRPREKGEFRHVE